MVELIKDGKYSVVLKISKCDVSFLLEYLNNLNDSCISVLFNGKIVKFEIFIDEIEYDLIIKSDSIKIYMDHDEIEYFKYRLNEVIAGNNFFPSELCERRLKNNSVTIYCIVV